MPRVEDEVSTDEDFDALHDSDQMPEYASEGNLSSRQDVQPVNLASRLSVAICSSGINTDQVYTEDTIEIPENPADIRERENERMRHQCRFQQAVDRMIETESHGAFSRYESQFRSSIPIVRPSVSGPACTYIYGKVHDLVVCVVIYMMIDPNLIGLVAPKTSEEYFSNTVDIDTLAKFLKEYFDKTPSTVVFDHGDSLQYKSEDSTVDEDMMHMLDVFENLDAFHDGDQMPELVSDGNGSSPSSEGGDQMPELVSDGNGSSPEPAACENVKQLLTQQGNDGQGKPWIDRFIWAPQVSFLGFPAPYPGDSNIDWKVGVGDGDGEATATATRLLLTEEEEEEEAAAAAGRRPAAGWRRLQRRRQQQ